MTTQSGRPPADPFWSDLILHSDLVIPDDWEENETLCAHRSDGGDTPRGCNLKRHGIEDKAHWQCRYYLGGKARIIATGTLFQCAKLYDYALVFFEKYRTKSYRHFNFGEETAKAEMQMEPGIARYFEKLEKHLLNFGDLLSPEALKEKRWGKRRVNQKAWRKKQSGTYQVLERIQENNVELIRLNSEVAEVAKQQAQIIKLLGAQKI